MAEVPTTKMVSRDGAEFTVNVEDVERLAKAKGWTVVGAEAAPEPIKVVEAEGFPTDLKRRLIAFQPFSVRQLRGMYAEAESMGLIEPTDTGKFRRGDWAEALAASTYVPKVTR